MKDISVYDNLVTKEDTETYRKLMLYDSPFFYGETDYEGLQPVGMVCDYSETKVRPIITKVIQTLIDKIYQKNENIKGKKIQRIYMNYFAAGENPRFHVDGNNIITCLYYLNPEVDCNEGGETQFLINDEIRGVRSKPGRLVIFDGSLKHRATSFRSHPRLTLAIKFYK